MIDLLTFLLLCLMVLLVVMIIWMLGGIVSYLAGGPLVPTQKAVVTQMVAAAGIQPGERAVDLGAGDGRLVFAAAEAGAAAVGYEVSYPAYLWSRLLQILGRHGGTLKRANIFSVSLQEADIVFCYLLPRTMKKLQGKFERELPQGARVVSNRFPVPGWPITERKGEVFIQYKPQL